MTKRTTMTLEAAPDDDRAEAIERMRDYLMKGVGQELHVIEMADRGDLIADLVLRRMYTEAVSDNRLPR